MRFFAFTGMLWQAERLVPPEKSRRSCERMLSRGGAAKDGDVQPAFAQAEGSDGPIILCCLTCCVLCSEAQALSFAKRGKALGPSLRAEAICRCDNARAGTPSVRNTISSYTRP